MKKISRGSPRIVLGNIFKLVPEEITGDSNVEMLKDFFEAI